MISATEYFAGIYQEIPKPILVLDAKMQPVFCSAAAETLALLPLPAAALKEGERCRAELRGSALPLQIAEQELTLYFAPSIFGEETYLVVTAELPPEHPELPGLMQVLRNSRGKLAGYLNAIYNVAQRIGLDSPVGKELGDDVRRIMRMAEHLDRLIDGEGRIIYRVPMDIGRLVAGYVRTLNEIELDQTILTAPYEQDLTARIMPEDMELALGALVSNALRFGNGKVTVRTHREGEQIYVTVADNGPGVEQPERLFEWGYRTMDQKGVKGLGFGLAMAKRVLALQGASLIYERAGEQTCFHIVMDLEPLPDQGRLAEWKPEPLENSLSQVRVELSDYIKEMQI